MKTFGLIILGLFLGLLLDFIMNYTTSHDISYLVRCWLDDLKKSRSGVVYIVRKTNYPTNLYLKEDYSYSKLGEGLAPLLFYSVDSAKKTMELLDWDTSNWSVIETSKDILTNVISWSRSEKPKKENFHKFGHTIDFDQIEVNSILSANENREKLIQEDKKKSCFNCKHGYFDHGYFCKYADAYMIGTTMCRFWEIKKGETNDIKPITRRCANCNHSERGNSMWYCFEHSRFMSPNGSCSYWEGEGDE